MTVSNLQIIPLNRLTVSTVNVRKTDRKADVAALAASIESHGLLQNLSVAPAEGDKFSVVAGGRRLAALKMLAKSGAIAKDYPVPCQVLARESGSEASLAENVHRVAMDPIDEAEAFTILKAQGQPVDDIARRFGVTAKHVDQRIALSGLSPRLKTAWKRRELSLEAARAFCLVEDHAQQDAVFKSLGKPVTHAGSVRARLMEGRMRASDKLVRFIGLDAYEAAGGIVRRDLFDADAVFIEHPALVAKLADEKLAAAVPHWKERGWGWIDTTLDGSRADGHAASRLQPIWRDPTKAEEAQMQELQNKLEALDAALDDSSVEDDPRWSERDDLEAAYETIRQSARTWDAELMVHAGVLLGIDHAGGFSAMEGLVRKEDQKLVDAIRRRQTGVASEGGHQEPLSEATRTPSIPKVLARELTQLRTEAIRAGVAAEPDLALALCVAALGARIVHRDAFPGVDINASASWRCEEDGQGVDHLSSVMPPDTRAALAWCLELGRDQLLVLLARLVAGVIDLAHEDTTAGDAERQGVADALAAALRLDMTRTWTPTLDFWMRLPKSLLLEELGHAAETDGLSETGKQERLAGAVKLKKEALAQRVEEAWRGRGYLPELLITPLPSGALMVNPNVAVAAE